MTPTYVREEVRFLGAVVLTVGLVALWYPRGSGASSSFAQVRAPSGREWQVEVANTPDARARGLAGRADLNSDGLLLVFPQADSHGIWMKGMKFALDLVWIDMDGRVLAIVSHAQPCESGRGCAIYAPTAAAATTQYVLELPAGAAEQGGVRIAAFLDVQIAENDAAVHAQ